MRAKKKDRRRYKREQRCLREDLRRIAGGCRKAERILALTRRLRLALERELWPNGEEENIDEQHVRRSQKS